MRCRALRVFCRICLPVLQHIGVALHTCLRTCTMPACYHTSARAISSRAACLCLARYANRHYLAAAPRVRRRYNTIPRMTRCLPPPLLPIGGAGAAPHSRSYACALFAWEYAACWRSAGIPYASGAHHFAHAAHHHGAFRASAHFTAPLLPYLGLASRWRLTTKRTYPTSACTPRFAHTWQIIPHLTRIRDRFFWQRSLIFRWHARSLITICACRLSFSAPFIHPEVHTRIPRHCARTLPLIHAGRCAALPPRTITVACAAAVRDFSRLHRCV